MLGWFKAKLTERQQYKQGADSFPLIWKLTTSSLWRVQTTGKDSIKKTQPNKKPPTRKTTKTPTFLTPNWTTNISHNFCACKSNSAHQLTNSRKQLFHYSFLCVFKKRVSIFSPSPGQMLSSSPG